MKITDVCIERPLLAWMIMAATIFFGVLAASRLGISQFPDVDFPTISVRVSWEGAAPDILEHDVIEPLEEAVVQVEGVRSISSSVMQGSGTITIEMDLARDVDVALQDVQAKIAQSQRNLPEGIDPPVVSKTNPEDQPIMWIGLSGPFSQQLISDTARYVLKERLQTVPGVGEVMMGGYLERNVRVWVDASRLDAKGLVVTDVIAALRREHVEIPAGKLETGGREISVRVLGEALDLAALRQLVLREEGGLVVLSDVALVEDGFEDVRRRARVNGVPAQGLGIKKQRGANAVAVAKGVREVMASVQKTLPEGMEVGVNFDSTIFIEESVHEIEWELLLAVILTGLVCWIFLGSWSSTLNVILAIPMSLLGTVAIVWALGYTLNTFTLLALSLSVGIVVDDAIMVLENIYRHREEGASPMDAARDGTREITFAALSATLAVVAIFIPVIFMEGIMGKFFLQFGVTLSVSVLLSYVEAITLAPARLSRMLKKAHEEERGVDRAFHALARGYGRVLGGALRRPLVVLALAVLGTGGAVALLTEIEVEMVPSQDQSRLMIRLTTAVGSDLEETDRLFRRAEAFVGSRPEVTRAFAVVGGFGGGSVNGGVIFTTLVPPDQRSMSMLEFAGLLRRELNSYPGLRAVVQDLSQSGFTARRGFPVEFSVQGPDLDALADLSGKIQEELRASGTVVDLDSTYQVGMPELRILPDRARAADIGVSMDEVATTVQALVGGVRVGKFSSGGRRIDVRLRLLADQRRSPEDVGQLKVRTAGGVLVPLSTVVTPEERPTLQTIDRRDRQRAISVFANVAPGRSQTEALAVVESLARSLPLGYRIVLGGQSVAFKEAIGGLWWALLLGIVVAYMILVSQFNSLLHPVTVLTILPLSLAGAALALYATGQTLNIFSMIGLLLLMGIVKKNSIILVDYANQIRAKGELTAVEAMRRAGPVRLRPILMTSVCTMTAALPSALQLGPGGEIRTPMAIGILGGLAFSTALSLVVVPAFYVVADRARARVFGLFASPAADKPIAES